MGLRVQEPIGPGAGKDDVCDLVERSEQQTGEHRPARIEPKNARHSEDDGEFDREQKRHVEKELAAEHRDLTKIDVHSDGDEEEPEQDLLGGGSSGLDLVGEHSGGEEHADHERDRSCDAKRQDQPRDQAMPLRQPLGCGANLARGFHKVQVTCDSRARVSETTLIFIGKSPIRVLDHVSRVGISLRERPLALSGRTVFRRQGLPFDEFRLYSTRIAR